MKGRKGILIFMAALFAAAALYYFFFTERSDRLILEGIVDANQVVVSPKIQGILERLNVDEGSSVRAGELIATLDTAELKANLQADQASVENLRAQLAEAQSNYQMALTETAGDLAGAEAKLSMAKAQLEQSKSQLERVRSDYQRTAALSTQGVSAKQDLDHWTADLRTQQATVAAQSEQVRAAEADLLHAQAGQYRKSAAKSAMESAQAQLQNAQSELDAAKSRLSYTQVVAPISGVVSVLVARQGEVVGPSAPIATIIDPQSTWVRVGIPETYADHIAVGEKLAVQFPSGQIVEGTVLTKGAEGDFATQYDLNQLNRAIRCVALKISVANPELTVTPGMTAKVLLSLAELKRKVIYPEKLAGE
ncbi:MAG: HlyD family secretion protein [Verrucomicrobia bacterium]|nr:HlyD family secretion protein [Verrucomicrobiota bacterium]